MSDILRLGQQWPDGYANNKFWIALNMDRPLFQHSGSGYILGRECGTLAELENVALEIELAPEICTGR
jgi:hypothetical protein